MQRYQLGPVEFFWTRIVARMVDFSDGLLVLIPVGRRGPIDRAPGTHRADMSARLRPNSSICGVFRSI